MFEFFGLILEEDFVNFLLKMVEDFISILDVFFLYISSKSLKKDVFDSFNIYQNSVVGDKEILQFVKYIVDKVSDLVVEIF